MKIKKSKSLLILTLGLIMLLALAGCKEGGIADGNSELVVNLLDQESEVETATVEVLQDGEVIESQEGRVVKFNLNNDIYEVRVSNEQYDSRLYDVYLSNNQVLYASLISDNDNLLGNANFTESLSNAEPDHSGRIETDDSWIFYPNAGGQGRARISDGVGTVMVTDSGAQSHSVQLMQGPVKLEAGARYRVTFDAKSSAGNKIGLKVGGNANRGWASYYRENDTLTGDWKTYEHEFTMSQDTDEETRFEFWFLNTGLYSIDNIRLTKVRGVEIPDESERVESDWELVWSEEFDGTEVDEDIWNFEVGNGHAQGIPGWGNAEEQYYTDGDNVHIEDDKLVITAREESRRDTYGRYDYTSTRMTTAENFEFRYGRVEAKAKLPEGQGVWPAIWMLGSNINDGVMWPESGEIDIMELLGHEPETVHGTVHGPGYSATGGIGGEYTLEDGKFSDDFHTFAIEWCQDRIEFYVGDNLYHEVSRYQIGDEWVYNQPFFLLLNIAVGGYWPGYPDGTTEFPQTMEVDYIRVYEDLNAAIDEDLLAENQEEASSDQEQRDPDVIKGVLNGDFNDSIVDNLESSPENWYVWTGEGGEVNDYGVENGEFKIDLAELGSQNWSVQFAQYLELAAGDYELTFKARAENERDIIVMVQENEGDWSIYGQKKVELNSEMSKYSFDVALNQSDNPKLIFALGVTENGEATTVYIDDVNIIENN